VTALSIDTARDAAQQVVTALIHRDGGLAGELAKAFPDPLILALVLADLTAHVHHRWSAAIGADPAEGWQMLMADIEEWRTGAEPPTQENR
jgi:hypothetical protein